jgi:predicted nucleic acid-binding protein
MTPVYVLDTNAISDAFKRFASVRQRFESAIAAQTPLILCQAAHYEVVRGLLWIDAPRQLESYMRFFVPVFRWEPVVDSDWSDAAALWAEMTRRGRKFSDIDLLLAVMVKRLNATLVSSDADFDALDIPRENWRR